MHQLLIGVAAKNFYKQLNKMGQSEQEPVYRNVPYVQKEQAKEEENALNSGFLKIKVDVWILILSIGV